MPSRKGPCGKNQDGEDLWEVEKIVRQRRTAAGQMEYEVKWLTYPTSENTWQSLESLERCPLVWADYYRRNPSLAPNFRLTITIPPPTSSRRNVEALRPRSITPSSSSGSDEETASNDSDSGEILGLNSVQNKRLRAVSDDFNLDESFKFSTLSEPSRGMGKNHQPPSDFPSPDSQPAQDQELFTDIFVPDGILPEYGSLMHPKNRLTRGSIALRRPSDFDPARSNPLTTESLYELKPVVHRMPLGEGFKKPVHRVHSRIINSLENEDRFDQEEFADLFQPTEERVLRNTDIFLGTSLPDNLVDAEDSGVLRSSPPPSLLQQPEPSVIGYTQSDGDVYPTTPLAIFLNYPKSLPPSSPRLDAEEYTTFSEVVYSSPPFESTSQCAEPSDQEENQMEVDSNTPLDNISQGAKPSEEHQMEADRKIEVWLNSAATLPCHFFTGESTTADIEAALLSRGIVQLKRISKCALQESHVVFVPVAEIQALSRCTGALRAQELKPVFVVYETNTESKHCMFEEIYPFGGLAMFTTGALAHNPDALMRKIQELVVHPLWKVHLLPSVFGSAIKQFYGNKAIWNNLNANFAFSELLDFISEGRVLLIGLNPDFLDRSEIIRRCIQSTPSRDIGPESAIFKFDEEILESFRESMVDPKFFRNYRRFVVLIDGQDESETDGIQFVPVEKFELA